MLLYQNYRCEMCQKTLMGKSGTAEISENYMSIKGTLSLQLKNEVGMRYFVTIISNPDYPTCFCDLVCLQDYCDFKEKMNKELFLQKKRERANAEWAGGGRRAF